MVNSQNLTFQHYLLIRRIVGQGENTLGKWQGPQHSSLTSGFMMLSIKQKPQAASSATFYHEFVRSFCENIHHNNKARPFSDNHLPADIISVS